MPLIAVTSLRSGFLVGYDKGAPSLVCVVAARGVPEQGAKEHDGAGRSGYVYALFQIDGRIDTKIARAPLFFTVGL